MSVSSNSPRDSSAFRGRRGRGSSNHGNNGPRSNNRYRPTNGRNPRTGGGDAAQIPSVPLPAYMEDVIGQQRIQERANFLLCSPRRRDQMSVIDFKTEWLTFGTPIDYTEIAPDFIEFEKLQQYLKLKDDSHKKLSDAEKLALHNRANPYEELGRYIFTSRDGPKLASLDKMFDFAISGETKPRKRYEKTVSQRRSNALSRNDPPFTFVDIGGAPGGFSDYVLWRKGYYNAKGFIAVVKNDQRFPYRKDFMQPGNADFLDFHTGPVGNNNLDCTENVESFVNYVKSQLAKHETTKKGDEFVNFVGAFGCYYPDGREMMQEILHHKLFLGNCLAGLMLARQKSGNMLIRVFDIFTPVTVGLIYCLYLAFHQIAIVKPVTCRPKNTEQFIFCEKLTPFGATVVKDYLAEVLRQWDGLPEGKTVTSVVPLDFIKEDSRFNEYILEHNKVTVDRQMYYIQFYDECSQNPGLFAPNGKEIRNLALKHWELGPLNRAFDARFPPPIEFLVGSRADKSWDRRNYRPAPSEFNPHDFHPMMNFYVTNLDFPATEFALVASDSRGAYFYLLDSDAGFVQTSFTGPPCTIFLVEANPTLFEPNMNKLVIHDAALLVDDAIAHLPLPQRLNAAQKFAKTARIVSYQGEAIILQVTKHLRLTTGKIRGNCRITRVLPLPKDDDPNDDLNSICETMSVLSFSSRQSQQSQKGGRNRMAERFWTSLMEGNSWMKS